MVAEKLRIWKSHEVLVGSGTATRRVTLKMGTEVETVPNSLPAFVGYIPVQVPNVGIVNVQKRNLTDKVWNGKYFVRDIAAE